MNIHWIIGDFTSKCIDLIEKKLFWDHFNGSGKGTVKEGERERII